MSYIHPQIEIAITLNAVKTIPHNQSHHIFGPMKIELQKIKKYSYKQHIYLTNNQICVRHLPEQAYKQQDQHLSSMELNQN